MQEKNKLCLPMLFGDHMVLQRQKPIEIWGKAAPGIAVFALLYREERVLAEGVGQADADGNWNLFLPAMEAARNLRLEITAGAEKQILEDVVIGEVWIAGGQSNMEYFLQFDAERDSAFARPEIPDIRFWDHPEISYEGQLDDYDYSEFGIWRLCRKEDLPWYSAVGYWFAEKLQGALDIPVGIVGCNWGGTRAACWIDRNRLTGTPGEVWLQDYEKGIEGLDPEAYKKAYLSVRTNIEDHPLQGDTTILYPGFSREFQLKAMSIWAKFPSPYGNVIGPVHPWRPCGVYETMLLHVAPYTCRGVLWYQGESDDTHAEIYDEMLSLLIANWRDLWHDEIPFLMVQLAPFRAWLDDQGDAYPVLRERQVWAAERIPRVWLASSGDAGMEWDIHPKHKRPIGQRLALLALGHIYGQNILCDAPEFAGAQWADGTLTISFRHGEGLYLQTPEGKRATEGAVNALEVDGAPISGQIAGDKLQIKLAEKPRHIAFAWTGYYQVNLYNAAGIPAKPFQTDLSD